MKIALIGATGFVGSAILKEALDRGHEVTAIVRHPEKLTPHPKLHTRRCDVYNAEELARLLADQGAVISAFSPGKTDPDIRQRHVEGIKAMIAAMKRAGIKRLLVVGGAGSLEVRPGIRVIDTPDFPEQWKGTARATADVLELLRGERDLDWTFLSPAAMLQPGSRTGTYREGTDQLLVDAKGESRISVEDYAVAMIDELENPRHIRRRFTVGY
ncbi:MAG TPA: NAD(P)-dependent oxidoreductase [Nitrospira sp.]|nr:NAD(P)-dependent oxidoreductase [Nitrospira sp.]